MRSMIHNAVGGRPRLVPGRSGHAQDRGEARTTHAGRRFRPDSASSTRFRSAGSQCLRGLSALLYAGSAYGQREAQRDGARQGPSEHVHLRLPGCLGGRVAAAFKTGATRDAWCHRKRPHFDGPLRWRWVGRMPATTTPAHPRVPGVVRACRTAARDWSGHRRSAGGFRERAISDLSLSVNCDCADRAAARRSPPTIRGVLLGPQRGHRMDAHGPPCGNDAGHERHGDERRRHGDQRDGIPAAHAREDPPSSCPTPSAPARPIVVRETPFIPSMCAGEIGAVLSMQVRDVEGVATHNGPESCVGRGNPGRRSVDRGTCRPGMEPRNL
jgi:hypothetical protein